MIVQKWYLNDAYKSGNRIYVEAGNGDDTSTVLFHLKPKDFLFSGVKKFLKNHKGHQINVYYPLCTCGTAVMSAINGSPVFVQDIVLGEKWSSWPHKLGAAELSAIKSDLESMMDIARGNAAAVQKIMKNKAVIENAIAAKHSR
ncbi:MAG: hypothetical protein LBH81_03820 [Rickettsiales bacterium]|jgi:hypothetical protein|nr:hypothetical protein [Rickettsiales bacterium]